MEVDLTIKNVLFEIISQVFMVHFGGFFQSLTDDFDDLSEAWMILLMDDENTNVPLVAHMMRRNAIIQKNLEDKLEEKRRLEVQVMQAELQLESKSRHLQDAKIIIRRERMHNKLMERKNKKMKDDLEVLLNQMPMNFKKETLAQLASHAELSTSDSHIDVDFTTDSSASTGISGASSHTSVQTEDSSDMEQAFCKRISSSTESDTSSVLSFCNMLQALKKRQHILRERGFLIGNKCAVCHKKFIYGRMEKFCGDCLACVHGRCQDRLPLPCIPTRKLNLRKMVSTTVADFCSPTFRPQIPAFIIHSVLVIEQSGFSQQGLYILPDYSRELATLQQELEWENFVPNFAQLKTSVVCELLKYANCTKNFNVYL